MKKLLTIMNSQYGTKIKINPKAYYVIKTTRVKSIAFIGGTPVDIYDGSADVFVTLKADDFTYLLEVTTPQALASHMDERKQKFLEPLYPFIIVR